MSAAQSGGISPSVALAAMYQRLVEVDGWKWQANYEVVDRVLRAVIEVTDSSQPDSRLMEAWRGR